MLVRKRIEWKDYPYFIIFRRRKACEGRRLASILRPTQSLSQGLHRRGRLHWGGGVWEQGRVQQEISGEALKFADNIDFLAFSGFTKLHVRLGAHVFLSRCQLLWLNVQKSAGLHKSENLKRPYRLNKCQDPGLFGLDAMNPLEDISNPYLSGSKLPIAAKKGMGY